MCPILKLEIEGLTKVSGCFCIIDLHCVEGELCCIAVSGRNSEFKNSGCGTVISSYSVTEIVTTECKVYPGSCIASCVVQGVICGIYEVIEAFNSLGGNNCQCVIFSCCELEAVATCILGHLFYRESYVSVCRTSGTQRLKNILILCCCERNCGTGAGEKPTTAYCSFSNCNIAEIALFHIVKGKERCGVEVIFDKEHITVYGNFLANVIGLSADRILVAGKGKTVFCCFTCVGEGCFFTRKNDASRKSAERSVFNGNVFIIGCELIGVVTKYSLNACTVFNDGIEICIIFIHCSLGEYHFLAVLNNTVLLNFAVNVSAVNKRSSLKIYLVGKVLCINTGSCEELAVCTPNITAAIRRNNNRS